MLADPPQRIADLIGVSRHHLEMFARGKAPLGLQARLDLEAVLGIEYDPERDYYFAAGPLALVAQKPLALKEAYELLSGGGDARPFELVPERGPQDPSWRYAMINTCGAPPSIVMAPRGSAIAERLPRLLMNYEGRWTVERRLYQDVVATCARASREPAANLREMMDFGARHEARWRGVFWLPD
jgi:transcriptional regulator with XRE-family HTH domain